MKHSKITLLTLSIVVSVLFSSFVAQTCLFASAASDLEDIAVTFVNLLKEREFDNATKLFNSQMAQALSSEELESTWNNLVSTAGEFEGINKTRTAEERGYQVVYVTCKFAKDSLDVRIVFDEEAQIAGLWFVATATEGIHGIYIAALIVTVVSIALSSGLLYWLSKLKWKYLALILVTLPFSVIVNLFIKGPILNLALSATGGASQLSSATPWWLLLFVLFLSPITEEAIKLSPLLAKQLRRIINRSSALWIGMALGIGFGIGEIWYLAWQYSMVAGFAGYPFYYFGGFIGERLIVVFLHGVMTAVAIVGFLKGKKGFLIGYLVAVLLHALTNIGAVLYQIGVWDQTLATISLFVPIVVAFFIFEHLRKKQLKDEKPQETVLYTPTS